MNGWNLNAVFKVNNYKVHSVWYRISYNLHWDLIEWGNTCSHIPFRPTNTTQLRCLPVNDVFSKQGHELFWDPEIPVSELLRPKPEKFLSSYKVQGRTCQNKHRLCLILLMLCKINLLRHYNACKHAVKMPLVTDRNCRFSSQFFSNFLFSFSLLLLKADLL